MCMHTCMGQPPQTPWESHPHPPTPTPNKNLANQDISILFEDIGSLDTCALILTTFGMQVGVSYYK